MVPTNLNLCSVNNALAHVFMLTMSITCSNRSEIDEIILTTDNMTSAISQINPASTYVLICHQSGFHKL